MFSKSFDEHVSHLSQVIDIIKSSGMKLSPKKFHLFRDKVKYVGHIISSKGIEADPGKINHVRNWPTPRTAAETTTFLGFSIYYRIFVKYYANIARPLHDIALSKLTCTHLSGKMSNKHNLIY